MNLKIKVLCSFLVTGLITLHAAEDEYRAPTPITTAVSALEEARKGSPKRYEEIVEALYSQIQEQRQAEQNAQKSSDKKTKLPEGALIVSEYNLPTTGQTTIIYSFKDSHYKLVVEKNGQTTIQPVEKRSTAYGHDWKVIEKKSNPYGYESEPV
jgi:hypothetical protein